MKSICEADELLDITCPKSYTKIRKIVLNITLAFKFHRIDTNMVVVNPGFLRHPSIDKTTSADHTCSYINNTRLASICNWHRRHHNIFSSPCLYSFFTMNDLSRK